MVREVRCGILYFWFHVTTQKVLVLGALRVSDFSMRDAQSVDRGDKKKTTEAQRRLDAQ